MREGGRCGGTVGDNLYLRLCDECCHGNWRPKVPKSRFAVQSVGARDTEVNTHTHKDTHTHTYTHRTHKEPRGILINHKDVPADQEAKGKRFLV